MLKKLTNKESMIDKETIIEPVEIEIFRWKNPNLGERNKYRSNRIIKTNKSPKASKVKVSKNKTQETGTPYWHPNYISHYFN